MLVNAVAAAAIRVWCAARGVRVDRHARTPYTRSTGQKPSRGDADNKPTLTPREYPLVAEQADAAHSKCAARTGM